MSTARVCKFPKQVREISYDSGQTWSATTDERIKPYSEPIERNSVDCGFSYSSRTVVSGSTCNGYHKYTKLVDEITYDGGLNWEIKEGSEQLGTLIERWSTDCCQLRTYSATVCTELFRQANVDIEQASLDGENWVDTGRYTVNEYLDEYNLDCMRLNNVKFLGIPTTGATGASYFDYKEYTVTTASTAQTVIGANGYSIVGCESSLNSNLPIPIGQGDDPNAEMLKDLIENTKYIYIGDCAENPKISRQYAWATGGYPTTNYLSLEKIFISSGASGVLGDISYDYYYRNCVAYSPSLTDVVGLENSQITQIGEYFFWGCTSLKSIHTPLTCCGIGQHAFSGCTSLTSVTIDSNALRYGVEDIDYADHYQHCFQDCTSLTDVTFPSDYYGKIYTGMFRNCPITAITLGNPSEYGDYSFNGNHLTSVNLGNRVTRIGQHAFESSTLTDVYIGQTANILSNVYNNSFSSGVTIHVPCEAFGYWFQSFEIQHPELGITIVAEGDTGCVQTRWVESGTTCIGYDKYTQYVKQVKYGTGDTWYTTSETSASTLIEHNSIDCGYIPTDFFVKGEYPDGTLKVKVCKTDGTNTLTWEDLEFESGSINQVIKYWVQGCSNVTPVTTIPIQALANISVMQEIDLPSTMTTIQDFAFYGDSNLTTLIIRATTPPALGTRVFDYCSSLAHIYVPAASVSAYQSATNWSAKASIISAIPNS